MSDSSIWIIPEAPPPESGSVQHERKSDNSSGLRLGILDNTKSNADYLLAMIVEAVKAELPIASVVSLRKPSAAAGAEPEMLEALAQEADCVITAMAD